MSKNKRLEVGQVWAGVHTRGDQRLVGYRFLLVFKSRYIDDLQQPRKPCWLGVKLYVPHDPTGHECVTHTFWFDQTGLSKLDDGASFQLTRKQKACDPQTIYEDQGCNLPRALHAPVPIDPIEEKRMRAEQAKEDKMAHRLQLILALIHVYTTTDPMPLELHNELPTLIGEGLVERHTRQKPSDGHGCSLTAAGQKYIEDLCAVDPPVPPLESNQIEELDLAEKLKLAEDAD